MKPTELKKYKNISHIMESELTYSRWMAACITAMCAAWILILVTCGLKLAVNPNHPLLWAFAVVVLAALVLSSIRCKDYCSMYRSTLSDHDASRIESDLSAEAAFLEADFPIAVTKKNVYIKFRCNLITIAREDIASAVVVINCSKRRVHESYSVQITTKDNRIFTVPVLTDKAESLSAEAVKAINA